MKKKLFASLLFVFALGLTAPSFAGVTAQEQKKEKTEQKKDCDKTKKECDKEKKAECTKAEKKACCPKAEKK